MNFLAESIQLEVIEANKVSGLDDHKATGGAIVAVQKTVEDKSVDGIFSYRQRIKKAGFRMPSIFLI